VRIFATLLRADSGRALVGGHDVVTGAAAVRR
jgi:ABC-type Na+ transport system ATPase subunit NatA